MSRTLKTSKTDAQHNNKASSGFIVFLGIEIHFRVELDTFFFNLENVANWQGYSSTEPSHGAKRGVRVMMQWQMLEKGIMISVGIWLMELCQDIVFKFSS